MRLRDTPLEDHRPLDDPTRRDHADARLHLVELPLLKNLIAKLGESSGLTGRGINFHDRGHVLLVQRVDLIDLAPDAEQGSDDRARAGPENQVKPLVQRAPQQALDLLEDPEGVTAVAAAARFVPPEQLPRQLNGADKIILVLVLAIYAVMGTVSFYEKATDKTASYFCHLGVILAIRDLWTKFQFEVLKEVMAFKSASNLTTAEAAARERVRPLVNAAAWRAEPSSDRLLTQPTTGITGCSRAPPTATPLPRRRAAVHGDPLFEAARKAAMEAFTRCWFRENKP